MNALDVHAQEVINRLTLTYNTMDKNTDEAKKLYESILLYHQTLQNIVFEKLRSK